MNMHDRFNLPQDKVPDDRLTRYKQAECLVLNQFKFPFFWNNKEISTYVHNKIFFPQGFSGPL